MINPFNTPCQRCRRVRAALLLAALLVLAVLLLAWPRHEGARAAKGGPGEPSQNGILVRPPAVVVAPAAAASAASAALIYTRLQLARLVVSRDWKGLRLVDGGKPPYALQATSGTLPPGLKLSPDGWLRGTPTTIGAYEFELRLGDGASAETQPYRIDVVGPLTPKKPTLVSTMPAPTNDPVDPDPHLPRTWRLSADDLKALAKPEGQPGEPPLDPADAPPPSKYQKPVLEALQDLEYPSESMFRQVLHTRLCAVYVDEVKKEATRTQREPDLSCPPKPDAPEPAPREPGDTRPLTMAQFHASLLEPATVQRVVNTAVKRHERKDAKPLALQAEPGCGCTQLDQTDDVHGFLAYWHADGPPQPVNLSLYTRLNYFGATLGDNGNWTLSTTPDAEGLAFVREAQRHGTQVDLVLHRRDWRFLRDMDDSRRRIFIEQAVVAAVELANTPMVDTTAQWQGLLLPFWRESPRAFGGLTLFFEDAPLEGADAPRYERFVLAFVERLMAEMRKSRHGYRLNIVIPDHAVAEPGVYKPFQLRQWQGAAESNLGEEGAKARRRALAMSVPRHDLPKPDIELEFLVPLSEPTKAYKKLLRSRLDDSATVFGHDRVALLQGIAPLLVGKRFGPPEPLPHDLRDQLDADFAYARWNFGGVALWPLPVPGRGRGEEEQKLLSKNYGSAPQPGFGADGSAQTQSLLAAFKSRWQQVSDTLCPVVCPNRVPWRLGVQTLALLELVALLAWVYSCAVRRRGRTYLRLLYAGGVLLLLAGLPLLACDPALEAARRNNLILLLPLLVLVALGARALFTPPPART